MSDDQFNPKSVDAMFATIIANQRAEAEKSEEFRTDFYKKFDALDSRVSVLEKFKFKLMGAVALATFLGGYVVDLFKGGSGK